MENKINVKTDGDISREAVEISGFEVDGSEYIIYCIDRDDGTNDNIFMSKLVKNNDGTYNMRNIEDASEKINASGITKSLVKTAVQDNDHDKYDGDTITVDGKTVRLFHVTINTEQVVNNQNSYVASVKKSVTEVTKKYFGSSTQDSTSVVTEPTSSEIPVISEGVSTPVEPVAETVPVEAQMPVLEDTPVTEPVPSEPVVDIPDGLLLQPEVPTPVATPTPEPVPEVAPVLLEPEVPVVTTPVTPEPVVAAPVQEPVPTPVTEEIKPVELSSVSDAVFIDAPVQQPVTPEPVAPVAAPTPAVNTQAMNIVANPEQASTVKTDALVLDGTHESNLNSALGEMSESIPVADISAVKEFGVDEPTSDGGNAGVGTAPVAAATTSNNQPNGMNNKAGFANSKFFMFVALAFFFASCVFLGYEVFNYFQIVK